MSEVLEHAARLSQVIGPRPGGTEEEQQASFFIEEVMQNAGLETSVEEFNCNPNYELPRIICCGVAVVCALLAVFLPLMVIPALILTLIVAILFILEVLGISPLNRTAKRGISQNVIGKYIPGAKNASSALADSSLIDINATADEIELAEAGRRRSSSRSSRSAGSRKRKIIVLARYDSGKVCPELKAPVFKFLNIIRWVEMAGMAVIPVFLFLRMVTNAEGPLEVFFNIFIIIGAVAALLPIIAYIMHQTAQFNDGANNNAAGVAVMLEVAKRVAKSAEESIVVAAAADEAQAESVANLSKPLGEGSPSSKLADAGEEVIVAEVAVEASGEQGARAQEGASVQRKGAGVDVLFGDSAQQAEAAAGEGQASDGASLVVMHGEQAVRESGMLPVDTDLIYEKAASGQLRPDEGNVKAYEAQKLVEEGVIGQGGTSTASSMIQAFQSSSQSQTNARTSSSSSSQSNVPDWFKRGLENASANKSAVKAEQETPIHRSRFADALDAAAATSANAFENFGKKDQEEKNEVISETEERLRQIRESIMAAGKRTRGSQAREGLNEEADAAEEKIDALGEAAIETANAAAEKAAEKKAEAAEAAREGENATTSADEARHAAASDASEEASTAAESTKIEGAFTARSTKESAASAMAEAQDGKSAEEAKAGSNNPWLDAKQKEAAKQKEPAKTMEQAERSLTADVAAAIEQKQAKEAAAKAQAVDQVVEQAVVADRTISYIPVAADIPAEETVSGTEVAVSALMGEQVEIGENAVAQADKDDSTDADSKQKKKRSISLPSLTGAIEAMSQRLQDAPLGDDAERKDGEGRKALADKQRNRQTKLASKLPSTDSAPLPKKGSTVAVASGRTSSDTSAFLAASAEADAQAALSSLDAPTAETQAKRTAAASNQAPKPSTAQATPQAAKAAGERALDAIPSVNDKTPSKTDKSISVAAAGAFVSASSTSGFEPVGDELIADMVEDEIIIHDVDDSDYTENLTHTGAMAGPGYVEMPKSRASRFRNLFGRKKKSRDDEISFNESIGVGEDFNARDVGAARGSWESFQNDSVEFDRAWADDNWADDDWNGGAFSLLRRGGDDGSADDYDDYDDYDDEYASDSYDDYDDGAQEAESTKASSRISRSVRSLASGRSDSDDAEGSSRSKGRKSGSGVSGIASRLSRRNKGSQSSQKRLDIEEVYTEEGEGETQIPVEDMLEEREQIRSFRTSSAPLTSFGEVAKYAESVSSAIAEEATVDEGPQGFQTEVWFVALGAELADNAGIKAFLAEHASEMSGAIVIDLDALGAGDLSVIDEEGIIRRIKMQSRMKRYVTKAGTALGLHINGAKLTWRESAAYFTAAHGAQTIHLAGMIDGKPAYQGEADDTFENLSEEKLLENSAFVLELLHNI